MGLLSWLLGGRRGKKAAPAPSKQATVEKTTLFREKLESHQRNPVWDDSPQSLIVKRETLKPGKELEENKKLREFVENSNLVKFLLKSEEIRRREIEEERKENANPLRKEDRKLWKKLPPVPDPLGGPPLVRKAIKTKGDGRDKFLEFFQQFQLGLWGYRQRPYPPEKPFDPQQALGYKWLDKRYFDFNMKAGGWYYKDRLGRSRGPMELIQMKTAWAAGIIDKNTFIWGDDLDEWAPIGMVYGLERAVVTPDVRLAALGTKFFHRISRGLNPAPPRKGHEIKSYKALQAAALARREKELNIMRNAGGVMPGERVPTHVLGMWAGGSQLTNWLDYNSKRMPDKFIPYNTRKLLSEAIPGLRPWEILDVESLWQFVTFQDDFYRAPLGALTGPHDYELTYYENERYQYQEAISTLRDVVGKTSS